ncbi:MAG: thermonuclease family protein [Cycloclasticus sp.]|nr:thermonuclease family protein [Cycloclasticus sp.]
MKILIIIAGVIGIVFAVFSKAPAPLSPEYQSGHVAYVIDGDTLILSGSKLRLRLWGVDAPEMKDKGGEQSKIALSRLVQGKKISFIKIDADKYGRTVARVFVKDQEINKLMIQSPHATEYHRYSKGFYGTSQ